MPFKVDVWVVYEGIAVDLRGVVGVCDRNGDGKLEGRPYIKPVVRSDEKNEIHNVVGIFEFYTAPRWKRHLCNICKEEKMRGGKKMKVSQQNESEDKGQQGRRKVDEEEEQGEKKESRGEEVK